MYPPLTTIRNCSIEIAIAIVEYAWKNSKLSNIHYKSENKVFIFDTDLATVHPKPDDLEAFVKSQVYNLNYPSASLPTW